MLQIMVAVGHGGYGHGETETIPGGTRGAKTKLWIS